jgi:hypothetical protein
MYTAKRLGRNRVELESSGVQPDFANVPTGITAAALPAEPHPQY